MGFQPLGGDALPALPSGLQGAIPFGGQRQTRKWNVIDGVSGVLKPGRLTLLLGTPGSGRSVLMKALAGRLGHEKTLKASLGRGAMWPGLLVHTSGLTRTALL